MKLFACLAVLLLFPALLVAENPDVSVNPGDLAPEFEAVDADGRVWKSSDHFGKRIVVVYFYPADMTTGCTKQACSFRDTFQELQDSGATVVGISGDSIRNHQLFRKVHSLNFRLLADEDGSIARAFGVPTREGGEISSVVDGVEETLVRGMTASRWTFIVGKDGRVIHKNTKVDAAEDGRIVLETIRQLATVAE